MGLDQYAFAVMPNPKNTDFSISNEGISDEEMTKRVIKIAEWRKHPNLQGWMEKLFNAKADAAGFEGKTEFSDEIVLNIAEVGDETETWQHLSKMVVSDVKQMEAAIQEQQNIGKIVASNKTRVFNNQPLRLNLTDLDQLEEAINRGELPPTTGFFFGEDADADYKEQDLLFVNLARELIKEGAEIYYDSWW